MAQQQNTSRRQTDRQPAPRRSDVIRCERCGEDYAKTYKRCPFCDERPGKRVNNTRGGGYGKRGSSVTPIQVVYLVVTMVIIIAALFIVLTKFAPLIFRGDEPAGSSVSSSQSSSGTQTPDVSQPAVSTPSVQEPVSIPAQAISLSREDFTLNPGEPYRILAAVSPEDTTYPVIWTSSDPTLATVDQDGTVTNVNQTIELKNVTITATCGDLEQTCIVRCKPGGTSTGTETPGTDTPGTTITPNSMGTVVNASSGLNIRSGPGSEYKKIASATNGSKVKILEDCGDGWLKIEYGNNLVGYVSSAYISAGN